MSDPKTSAMRLETADGMPAASVAANRVVLTRAERVMRRRSSTWSWMRASHLPSLSDSTSCCGGVLPWLL